VTGRGPRLAAASLLIAVTLMTAWALSRPSPSPSGSLAAVVTADRARYVGTLLDPPPARPALRLPDTAGELFDLRARPPGEVTVLFFGYTNCDDICPTTMADLAAARRVLPDRARRHVTVVFITEDPERDTPAVLRPWLDAFDPAIVGLIGGNTSTRQVLDQLHLPASLRYKATEPAPHSHAPGGPDHRHLRRSDYEVEHSGVVYAFGPARRAVLYTGGTTPAQYADDFARLLGH